MPGKRHLLAFMVSFVFVLPRLQSQAPLPDSAAIERQANAMLAKLTLDDKIDFIGGEDGMFIRAEPAAGFPKLRMSDGPMGVGTWGPSTAYGLA